MDDAKSYHSLMRGAGYSVDNGILRAQMVRGDQVIVAVRANEAKRTSLSSQQQHGTMPRQSIY
eukprot:scaffold4308_cov145-Alexandrium_tamarense.AAC.1